MSKKHATTGKATPAIAQLENAGITFRVVDYEHDADHMDDGYGMEAAQKLGVNAEQVCKTLMVDTGEKRVVGIVPVNGRLSMKAIASAVNAK
ncbi:Cys-tRNA(Pro) deacylase, partial [Gardnerella vaginalis]